MQKKTIEVLQSFAAINQGIIVREGNVLRTMSQSRNIFGTATVPDTFPREFAIYNLNEFLSILSLFDAPEIAYNDEHILIKQGKVKIKFFYSSPSVIIAPPVGKEVPVKDVQLEFTIKKEVLASMLKAAAVMKATDLVITSKGLTAINKKGSDNAYELTVDDIQGESDDEFSLKIDPLKFLLGGVDYKVRVTPRVVAFDADDLCYVYALEKSGA